MNINTSEVKELLNRIDTTSGTKLPHETAYSLRSRLIDCIEDIYFIENLISGAEKADDFIAPDSSLWDNNYNTACEKAHNKMYDDGILTDPDDK